MQMSVSELLPVEREALLEALRRDLRSEREFALQDSRWQIWHQRNVQLSLRLLEALNPKAPRIRAYCQTRSKYEEIKAGIDNCCCRQHRRR